jgi:hypothetical protein
MRLEPGALAGKGQLQHLTLTNCQLLPAGPAGVAGLLFELQSLQHLTAWKIPCVLLM